MRSAGRGFRAGLTVAAGAFLATALMAAPADIVKTRVTGLRELGAAFKNVNDELKSGTPQAIVLTLSARQIRDSARQQYGWFPAGSGPQPGVKTAAKPEIWSRAAEFKTAQDNFATQANAFAKIAGSGDGAALRAQAKALGQTCAACHRIFRTDDKS
ncbi:MAG TPA: cytochrome c [Sphingobium sp.]|uniref:c-type cytochrome n=1 Tax=Sphingobium sp. TaxID=1912891 RepID=UPI002ED229D9